MCTDVPEEQIISMFRVENQPSKKPACSRWLGWFLARLISHPEDGGEAFLQNVSSRTDYTAQYPITIAVKTSNPTNYMLINISLPSSILRTIYLVP
jgi:hypothetical protein